MVLDAQNKRINCIAGGSIFFVIECGGIVIREEVRRFS